MNMPVACRHFFQDKVQLRAPVGRHLIKLSGTALCYLTILGLPYCALAEDYFNPEALEIHDPQQKIAALEQFSRPGGQVPGTYRVDIYMNGRQTDTRDITFVTSGKDLKATLTPAMLRDMGVRIDAFPALASLPAQAAITDPGKYIPAADSSFDFGRQRLNISIPQAALDEDARNAVSPQEWSQGLPALFLNYTASGARNNYSHTDGTSDNLYLNLRSGANLGPWRFRNYSTYSDSRRGSMRWDTISSYLQRDVQMLKGQFTGGDYSTPGDVFDSVPFRGAQLASDDNMLPDSMKGFAPVVRGIARTNAQVIIRQGGYVIYQTYVAPGPFAITDLYPTSSSGNLEVTVRENGGGEQHFTQPFSAVPVMQREGRLKYAATAGEYRPTTSGARRPFFVRGTAIYGLPADTTVYTGATVSGDYNAGLLGVGHGFGDFGSLSLDVSHARTTFPGRAASQGESLRIQYSKDINSTGTTFTLAGYRYSSHGYYDFQEANDDTRLQDELDSTRFNKRSKTQLYITQTLDEMGSFFLSGYQQDYWGLPGHEYSLSAGYNLGYKGITYGLNYTYSKYPGGIPGEQLIAFSVQIPLSRWLPNSWASYTLSSSRSGDTQQLAGLTGTLLEDNNLSYSVQQGYGSGRTGATGSASLDYRGTYGEATGGYNYNRQGYQLNYGLRGAIVAHPYGVTLSQPLGDTIALVRAPGASGARVINNTGVRTDWRGYTVVPYVSTYRRNRIALDSETLDEDVDVDTKTQTVVPTQGALVLADFNTRIGERVLLTLMHQGHPVPFGATVSIENDNTQNSGIVGEGGEVYLSGMPQDARVLARWGAGTGQHCMASLHLPAAGEGRTSPLRAASARCM